jgi:Epoxide hydrolase N terminus
MNGDGSSPLASLRSPACLQPMWPHEQQRRGTRSFGRFNGTSVVVPLRRPDLVHVKSRHPNALPLIMTHGWPGSVIELLETVGPLTDRPRRTLCGMGRTGTLRVRAARGVQAGAVTRGPAAGAKR